MKIKNEMSFGFDQKVGFCAFLKTENFAQFSKVGLTTVDITM